MMNTEECILNLTERGYSLRFQQKDGVLALHTEKGQFRDSCYAVDKNSPLVLVMTVMAVVNRHEYQSVKESHSASAC